MAAITSKVIRDGQSVDIPLTPKVRTNIQVINKIYNTTDINTLLNDDTFMAIVVTNGYYKAAFCDKFALESANIKVGTTTYKFIGLPERINVQELLLGESKTIPIDVELVDEPI